MLANWTLIVGRDLEHQLGRLLGELQRPGRRVWRQAEQGHRRLAFKWSDVLQRADDLSGLSLVTSGSRGRDSHEWFGDVQFGQLRGDP